METKTMDSNFAIGEISLDNIQLLNAVTIPLCFVKASGEMEFFNKKFIELFGYTNKELKVLDDWWINAYPDEEYRRWVIGNWDAAVEKAKINNTEIQSDIYNVTCLNGEIRKVIIGGVTIGNDFLANFVDVTELQKSKQELQFSEDKFRAFFEHSGIGKSITGMDGQLMINQAFADILGYTREELLNLKWMEITHPDDIEESKKIVQELKDGVTSSAKYNKRYIHKSGNIVWTELTTTLERDKEGNPLYFLTAISDITKRKEAEDKLLSALEDLKRSNQELEQFAYVASHDLQEPLRMVSSYTQLLGNKYKSQLDEKAEMYIHFAVDGATRMQTLINDLLEFSRISTRGEKFKKYDAHELLGKAMSNLRPRIEESKAIITNDGLPEIIADGPQMIRLFQNLISNAIKFKGTDLPHIHISAKKDKESWIFSAKDNGKGINQKYFEKIFVIFQRLHSHKDYEGTGIGLAVCKRIVERHSGKIWLESEEGKGSTFYFSIPIKNQKNK